MPKGILGSLAVCTVLYILFSWVLTGVAQRHQGDRLAGEVPVLAPTRHLVVAELGLNDAVQRALASGGGTDYGDQYFFTNPRFETGDERYAWLNTTFFIGEGRILPGPGVEYRVWRPK